MVTGFNHNVKYRDRVFHVQTEDNGEKTPLIFTHLFDGGDILATKKIDYKMIAGKPDFEKQVRRMMEDQHKAMLKALMRGEFDEIIDAHDAAVRAASAVVAAAPPPASEPAAHGSAPTASPASPVPAAPEPPVAPAAAAAAPSTTAPGPAKKQGKGETRKGVTIFGESLISERTLDEVILNYLIDQGSEKK